MDLLNEQRDIFWLLNRAWACVSQHPLLLIGFTAYWVWVNLLLQTPMLFPSLVLGSGLIFPLRLVPIGFSFLSFLVISLWFKKTKRVIRERWFIIFLAILMIVGGLLIIAWFLLTFQPSIEDLAVASLSMSSTTVLSTTLYLIGSLLTGFATACFCIEFQRIFGSLGAQYVLYIGCLSVVLSCLILAPFIFLPWMASFMLFMVVPLVIAFCHRSTVKHIATKTYYTHGLSAKLIIPKKLLITSILHGLSIGVLIGYPPIIAVLGGLNLHCLIAFVAGAVLLFTLSVLIKMDYNHLLYQVGFPLVALGALFLVCLSSMPLIGTILQLAGFCFIHLVMWGVCTYFITNLNLPATWTIGISTCGFMFGQLAGAITTMLLNQAGNAAFSSQNLAAMIVFVTLFASLLMMSSTNLRTGWGLARLDMYESPETETDHAVESLVAEFLLTERQTSILIMLTRGRSRRVISEELYISEETVKTHIRQLYRKLQVHSRQELIDLYEKRCTSSQDEMRKPLFTSERSD